jgi:nucleoside-diphosphate-sugar epimerase
MRVDSPSDSTPAGRRALVTGINGFTGHYVADELRRAGYDVVGLGPAGTGGVTPGFDLDLCDREAVIECLKDQAFDAVVHLAGIAFVAHGNADAIYQVNVLGTRHLLEGLASAPAGPRVVVLASSANVYGNADVEPITEAVAPAPVNDYGVSKLAMEYVARLWEDRLPIVVTRPFNYTGVGQSAQFLIPKIVDHYRRRAAEIELGNIDVVRDFMDVRDVAKLYRLIVEQAPAGRTFNICSGRGHSLADVLEMAGAISGHRLEVKVNPAFVRSSEVKRLVGSTASLSTIATDFTFRPLRETLAWMLESQE